MGSTGRSSGMRRCSGSKNSARSDSSCRWNIQFFDPLFKGNLVRICIDCLASCMLLPLFVGNSDSFIIGNRN